MSRLNLEKRDPEKPFLPKHHNEMDWRWEKLVTECRHKAEQQHGWCCGSASGVHLPREVMVPLPTAQVSALSALALVHPGRGLACLRLQKTWMGMKCTAVILHCFAEEVCRVQAEDAARLLSVDKAAHLPASVCHVVGRSSLLPPALCLIPSIFCSLTLSIYPFPISPAGYSWGERTDRRETRRRQVCSVVSISWAPATVLLILKPDRQRNLAGTIP